MQPPGTSDPKAPTPREVLWAVSLSGIVCVLFFFVACCDGFLEWADGTHFFLATKAVIGERLRAGDFPLWTPLLGIGSAIGADPSSGLFYPTTLLYMALPPLVAQSIDLLLHPLLSLTFAYLYARRLGLSHAAAALAALAYGLSGFAVVHYSRHAVINTLPWLPAVALLLEGHRQRPSPSRLILSGLVLGLTVLAGHPQAALYTWLAVALYLVSLAVIERRVRLALEGVLPFVIGSGIAALQLLPAAALVSEHTRGGFSAANRAVGTLRPEMLPRLVSPTEGFDAFIGLIPVLLGLLAIVHARRLSPPVRAWIPVAAIATLLMLGSYTPLEPLLSRLPAFELLRFPARHAMYLTLAMGLLCGAALDLLARPRSEVLGATLSWLRRRGLVAAFLVGIVIAYLRLFQGIPTPGAETPASATSISASESSISASETSISASETSISASETSISLGPSKVRSRSIFDTVGPARNPALELGLFLAVGLSLWGLRRHPRRAVWLFPLLQLADSWTFSRHRTESADPPAAALRSGPAIRALAAQPDGAGARLFMQPPWVRRAPHRVATSAASAALAPNAPAISGLSSVLLYSALQPRHLVEALSLDHLGAMQATLLAKQHVLSLIGTRFVVLPRSSLPLAARLTGSTTSGSTVLVATLPGARPPSLLRNAAVEDTGLRLQAGETSPFGLAEVDVPLIPDRSYVLTLEVSAPEGRASAPVVADLYTGELSWDASRALAVPASALGTEPRRHALVVDSIGAAGAANLRVHTSSVQPIHVERLSLHLRPLPRIRAGSEPKQARATALYEPVARVEELTIFRNRAAFPRAWLVREAVPAASPAEAHRLRDRIGDLAHTAPVEGLPERQTFVGGTAHLANDSGDRLFVTTASQGPGLLVVNDLLLPGWQAQVDGRPAPIYRAYGFLRAIPVPAGAATVALTYRAPGLIPGLVIFAITLLGSTGALLIVVLRRRRQDRGPRPGPPAPAPKDDAATGEDRR